MQETRNTPTCRKHGRLGNWRIHTKISTGFCRVTYIALFTCTQCPITVATPVPTCKACKVNMSILEDSGKLFWQCKLHDQLEDFELCECGGYGYLEMESDYHRAVKPTGLLVIGHDGGYHIQRCGGCGHYRFADDVEAERAHRKECGCGHGSPPLDRPSLWVDYPGRNLEILHAMQRAGFKPQMASDEVMEVVIFMGQAELFTATLDACYDNMHLETERRLLRPPGAPVCYGVHYDPKDKQECGTCSFKTGCAFAVMANSYRPAINHMAQSHTSEEMMRAVNELTKSVVGRRGEPTHQLHGTQDEDPTTSSAKASIISKEEMRKVGFRQLRKRNGKATVTRQGYPVGYLMGRALDDEEKPSPTKEEIEHKEKVKELLHAGKKLFDALNSMNFQYHPKDEVLELESRRCGLKDAMANLQAKLTPDDVGGRERDRKAYNWGEFHDAGGYRIETLRKLEDEAVLKGVIFIHGSMHHIQFIQVHNVNGEQQPVDDPHNRFYDGVGQFQDCYMETTKVTGFPGDYVMFIFPRGH